MEQVNVFGGSGFVGSHYIKYNPNCLVNDRNDYEPKTGNLLYFISTVDNYNVFTDPHLDINTNLNILIDVLEKFRLLPGDDKVFNFISSWFVYGAADVFPVKETSSCNPTGFYSITKRAAEQLLMTYCKTFGMNYRILRLANVVGSTDTKASKKKNALVWMINELKQNNSIQMYNDGFVWRDIIDVEDCVRAIDLILNKGELDEIYNVGNGEPVKLKHYIDTAIRLTNSTSEVTTTKSPQFHKNVQGDYFWMSNYKLTELGYHPKYTIEETIQRIIDEVI